MLCIFRIVYPGNNYFITHILINPSVVSHQRRGDYFNKLSYEFKIFNMPQLFSDGSGIFEIDKHYDAFFDLRMPVSSQQYIKKNTWGIFFNHFYQDLEQGKSQ